MDPLQKRYAELTSYQFASNSPIQAIDLDGLESAKVDPITGAIIPIGPVSIKNPGVEQDSHGSILFYATKSTPMSFPKRIAMLQQRSDFSASVKAGQVRQMAINENKVQSPPPPQPKYSATIAQETRTKEEIEEGVQQHNQNLVIAENMQTPEGQGGMALANMMHSTGKGIVDHSVGYFQDLSNGNFLGATKNAALLWLDLDGLAPGEAAIVREANVIINSKEFGMIENAYKNGEEISVKIGDRIVNYNPETGGSSITLHASPYHEGSGFQLGPDAFKSDEEVKKTLIQELYRLRTQGTGELRVDQTRQYTDNAAAAAERLHTLVKKQ